MNIVFPAAIFSYSGMPWVIILPTLVAFVGRKITHSFVCIATFVGFIIFYNSNDVYMILISEIFQGVVSASYLTIAIAIITEYTSAKNRGLFLTIKSATFFWGVLASNLIGTFFHWKKIALFGLICSIYSLGTVYFWPESPLWLVTKGRFDQCAAAHRWLKGSSMSSEKELEKLISEYQNDRRKRSLKTQVIESIKVMVKKEFYKPVLLSVLLMALYVFSGKLVCTVYAIDMLKKITNNESTAYAGMLILDSVTVSTMYVGCALSKAFKRRTLLLTSSSIAIVFLFLLSLYLYLVKASVVSENKYFSIILLTGYSVAISCGPMILSTSICGELISTDSRSLSMCAIALSFKTMYGTFVKVCPYLFKSLGMHGTFLLFALSSSVCLVLLYFYLPETKDMSLQEISDCIKGIKPVEEAKELLPIMSKNVITIHNNKGTVGE